MPHTGSSEPKQIVWPWFVSGSLVPFGASVLTGPVPSWLAAGLSFFALFAAAGVLVLRASGKTQHPLGRSVMASLGGAIIVAALKYAFP